MTSMSRWDGAVSSASISLAKVFCRTNDVYYIDYPYSWADMIRERKLSSVEKRLPALLWGKNNLIHLKEQPGNLLAITPKAVLPIFSLPEGLIYDKASHYNNKIVAGLVKRIAKQQKISNYIFINSFNPTYLSNIDRYLSPVLSIYHSRDAIEEVKGHGLRKENECVKTYDMAMATSKQLCRNISNRNQKTVHYFPNGGDVQLFKTALEQNLAKPKELENITTAIIGYTGALAQREDYRLIEKIAKANPDKTIVFVGPRKDKEFTDINLDAIPNILFTGAKKINELPAYLQYFDCAIIPFLKNNLTGGIYPLKINEYLAAGKSVITTDFSEDINSFKDHISIAATHDDFLKAIAPAIGNNSTEKKQERLKVALSNSWEKRSELFWDIAWEAYQLKSAQQKK